MVADAAPSPFLHTHTYTIVRARVCLRVCVSTTAFADSAKFTCHQSAAAAAAAAAADVLRLLVDKWAIVVWVRKLSQF